MINALESSPLKNAGDLWALPIGILRKQDKLLTSHFIKVRIGAVHSYINRQGIA